MAVVRAILALPGYWLVTALALAWGAVLGRFHVESRGGVIVCSRVPRWAFGRGGTTIGAVYLTSDNLSERVLKHEAVHRAQWRRWGLAFIPLYLAAGRDPLRNRFEVEAGLEDGGYRGRAPSRARITTAEGASPSDGPAPTAPPVPAEQPPRPADQ